MAVRALGSVPRKLAAFCLALFLGQSVSVPLLAGGATRPPAKAKGSVVSEQTLTAEEPARLEGADDDAVRPDADDDAVRPHEPADSGAPWVTGPPRELRLQRARSWDGDLSALPQTRPVKRERPEREGPGFAPRMLPGGLTAEPGSETPSVPTLNAPAPAATVNFDGLDFANWGAGHPPDTNGDVGPTYYIETINTSIGVFRKSDQVRVAAFTFNTFMSQGAFGNRCDTQNFGDPVVVYDTFEDRWMITDFAFQLDGGGNVIPPSLQCLAVSKTGDPVNGGWNFYSIETLGGLGDYPKFGVWPDGIYMSANMFGYASGAAFQGARVWAFNKAQMYAGAPTVQVVTFNAPPADFALLPSNARLQTGTPPAGTPNYYVSTEEFLNALTVYKFHVDWQHPSLSSFTGPDTPLAATSWPNANVPNAPSLGGNALDVLQIRAMMQAQYTNFGGAESLWTTHTVRRANTTGFAAPRWYQVDVTGGTVNPNLPQATTWDPDGANVIYRFMPSLALNRNGDLAMGYSTSSASTKPAIKYAGRSAADPINTFSQTEQLLIQGTGTQVGNCGSSACIRWGDYSAMTLDPDGCTFWYTNEYYAIDGLNHQTRIGAFALPGCTTVGNGTLSGTVTDLVTTNPIAGATVTLGSRTTTTDGSGLYSFTVPAGTYPSETASSPGYNSSTVTGIVVSDGGTTTQNFALTAAARSGCLTDTTQTDFQGGVPTNCDLNSSPGDVILLDAQTANQQNTTLSTSGVGITTTTFGGQTFTPSVTAPLTKADINLFCSGCTGTTPNLTLSVRATSGGLPTGPDLATATIPGFGNGGVASYFTGTFSSPITVTAGTMYALVIAPTVNPAPGTYALTRSANDVYPGGTRVSGATSGTVWSIPLTAGVSTDAGFRVYLDTGFPASGTFTSSLKDANPAPGWNPHWTTLSWTADTPSGTNVQFQVAASNSATGPFTFVGPDGTPATFFSNGGSLAQFNGNRYLQYQATLSTSSSTVTPTLHDVTACFEDLVPTTTAITSDLPDPSVYGAPVAVTYTVTPSAVSPNTPTGNVFVTDGIESCTGTVLSGGCSLTLHTLGLRTLVATYQGDANFEASPASAGEPHIVIKADTTAAITADPTDPSVVGQSVVISYSVTPNPPASGTPTGTVTVTDGVDLCTGTLPATSCSITLTTAGVRNLTATYNGDTNFNASPASTIEPHTVSKAATTTTITSDLPDPSALGQPVSVSYSVIVNAPGAGTPTGNVTVSDGVDSCTATVADGGCVVSLTTAGTRLLIATYAGDASFATSASAPESHVVTGANNLAGVAKDVSLGSVSTDVLGSAPNDHNWFRYGVQAGRSYCVEVDNGKTDTTIIDPFLSVYHADGTTSIGTNDNIADEPGGPLLSRVCYIAATTEDNLADVTSALGGGPGGFRVRVVDTTLFSPWFATGNGFEAFILIKNTSGSAYNVTVTLVDESGAPMAAPQSAVVPANGSYNLQLSAPSPAGFGLSAATGSVLIVHDAPPGALISSVASISFTTGVSFDTPSSPRQEFRR